VEVLGFRLDLVSLEEAARWVMAAADGASGASTALPSPGRTAIATSFNPELVMLALEDPTAAEALRAADLCYPDGVGAVWAARRTLEPGGPGLDPGPQRVAGIDLAQRVLESAAQAGTPVYCLGARPGVAEQAARRQRESLPGLRIAGCRDGYFSPGDEAAVVDAVRNSGAAILLVAMGAPKQEKLLFRHRDEWGAPVALGVGGSFDVWAGNTRRAPEWVRKAGVEWLFRLAREPKRLRRQLMLPRFAYRVVCEEPETAGTTGKGDGV
jgi:N-acetylglucosaminyldiphosphoundecaprenol N-acetyl-beta-D-mannosaminyltransferase